MTVNHLRPSIRQPVLEAAVFLEVYPQALGVTTVKVCSKCGEVKPIEQFHMSGTGRRSNCKACVREYHQSIAEHLREYNREYHAANAERKREYRQANAERIKARDREYNHANAERIADYQREYQRANAERIAERKRKYWKTPGGKAVSKSKDHRRLARKRGLANTFTSADWQIALDYFGGCCAACGRPRGLWHTLAADHFVPLSNGGPTTPDNIIPLCHGVNGCNNSKGNRDAAEWLTDTFGKRKGRAIQKRIEAYLNSRKAGGAA